MSDTSIMSVGELIDTAFGDPDVNVVNFKLIQTVLLLIARQLSILERYVAVKIGYPIVAPTGSRLSIREVKVHAVVPKKDRKKLRGAKPGETDAGAPDGKSTKPGRKGKGEDTASSRGDDEPYGKPSKSRKKGELDEDEDYAADKRSVSSKGKPDKTSKRKGELDTDKDYDTKSDKAKGKSREDKKYGKNREEEEMEGGRERGETEGRDVRGKSKGKSGKYLKADEYEGSGISSQASEETLASKGAGKRPYDKQDSKASKSGKTEKGAKGADKGSFKGDSRVSGAATSDSKRKTYLHLLDKLEEERERVLRVIHQRADSHEEHMRTPTPMASVESIDTDLQQEKLLIVEKIGADKDGKGAKGKKGEKGKGTGHEGPPRLSVVTQDQFQRLLEAVKDLEAKFGPLDLPFLDDLRRGVPLSDALAGLQLASRLDATERALARMINVVTNIAEKTPGVNVKSFTDLKKEYSETVTKLHEAESQYGFHTGPTAVHRVEIGQNTGWPATRENEKTQTQSKGKTSAKASETASVASTPMTVTVIDGPDTDVTTLSDMAKKNYVTYDQFESAMQGVYDEYTATLTTLTNRSNAKADAALKTCAKMESEIGKTLNVEKRMNELQEKIQSYVERINILDTGLSTQMTNYQEQLTQMQHDLETGLDNMAEALATQTGDTEAIGEMNQNFSVLQTDFDRTRIMQKDLGDIQEAFAVDLSNLKKELEILRDAKSDRDEVADALRDKAGLSILNGLVTQVQFDAVQGDLEKRIRHAYDKFNSQEVVWQKAIDDLIREINEKASTQQVECFRDITQEKINVLKDKLDFMLDILGEPHAAGLKRQIFRDTECLSCSTPAKMKMEEPGSPEPVWPEHLSYKKGAGEGVRVGKAIGDGDHVPCIPGLPPPHPIDPRAEFCTRYCGGRHTLLSHANRAIPTQLPDINISKLTRETRAAIGDDGKVYKVEYEVTKKPCRPCNVPRTPPIDDKLPERDSEIPHVIDTETTRPLVDYVGDNLVSAILSELKTTSREEMSTADVQEEKLLVVDIYDDTIKQSPEDIAEGSKLVTQDQFQKLVDEVIKLQDKYGPLDIPDFPGKVIVKGMQESAPLSSSMGAMQLASSMEIVESCIERIFIIIRELVIVKIKEAKAAARREQDIEDEEEEEIEGEEGGGGGTGAFAVDPLLVYVTDSAKKDSKSTKSTGSTGPGTTPAPSAALTQSDVDVASDIASDLRKVTVDELETAMWDMYDDCFKGFLNRMKKCNTNTAVSKERCAKLDDKLKMTSISDEVMDELEAKVMKYTSRIDELNNMFSAMTMNIQDHLNKMHHDLDTGLMDFFASYSKQPKRHAAITELINKFMDQFEELEEAETILVEFKVRQAELFEQCSVLKDDLKIIADVKSSRRELRDSIEQKVSLRMINGFIKKVQGYAVQGDMEKKIKLAYEKFNTQEYLWQKSLDDLTRYLNDRVDLTQLDAFRNAAKRVGDMIAARLNYMTKLVGDAPKLLKISKKIMRKKDCASCGAPVTKAMQTLEKENKDPNVFEERAKGTQVRDKKQKIKKERDVCFPGLPVPHARDPRGRICSKYCGSTFEPLPCINIKQFREKTTISEGTETQTAGQKGKPCSACNKLQKPIPKQGVCDELCTAVPYECSLPDTAVGAAEPCDELRTEIPCEFVSPKMTVAADQCDELCTEKIPCESVSPKTTDPCDELCTEIPCECVSPKCNMN